MAQQEPLITFAGRTFAQSKVLDGLYKSLGVVRNDDIGSVRSVMYHCHRWLEGRESGHQFTFKTIDRERREHAATGALPECVMRYYVEVADPAE